MRRGLGAALVLALLGAPGSAAGDQGVFGLCTGTEPRPCASPSVLYGGGPLVLGLKPPAEATRGPRPRPDPRTVRNRSLLIGTGAVALTVAIGWMAWWVPENRQSFHITKEGWFGQDTYSGGADKASHFVFAAIGQELLTGAFRLAGQDEAAANWWAFGSVSIAGVALEIGDGNSIFGASWEDAVTNVVGAGAAMAINRAHLNDTIGFRMGKVKRRIPPPCCRADAYGTDYTSQIYTADLKLAGFLPRVGVAPGIGRFFLVSLTYGSKGYRYSGEEWRQRNVGIDLGLNVPEILRAVGVRDDSWWGKPLLTFLTYFRIPYSAFGWHYDMNSHRWFGPDTGDKFDPGAIIYD